MHTDNAYRRPAWRCPSCGATCQCLAPHRDCRDLRPRYGHHFAVPVVERRHYPGE